MANLKKSFNFRHGVQVDDDNFIVDTLGKVGIGSTVPTEYLDVGGNIRIRGTVFADEINAKSLVNTSEDGTSSFKVVNVGVTSMTSGIITASGSGIVTYYGDARYLQGMPTSQWVDTDVGLGYTSIYAAGNVGIATTDPRFSLQIGDTNSSDGTLISGVGIDSGGHIDLTGTITTNQINATGIATASKFSGIGSDLTGLTADNIAYGSVPSNRFNNINTTGIITATSLHGAFVGIASTARNLTSDAIVSIDSVTSNRSDLGVTTTTTLQANTLYAVTSVGIGTSTVSADLHLRKDGVAEVQITSNDDRARLVIGRDTTAFGNNFIIDTDNDDVGAYPEESGLNSVDIYNYATGNLNFFIRPDTEVNKKFNWINHTTSDTMMSLTQGGRLGIGKTNPDHDLHVVGTSTVTSNSYIGGDFEVKGSTTLKNSLSGTSITLSDIFKTSSKLGIGLTVDDEDPSFDFQVGYGEGRVGLNTGAYITERGEGGFTGIVTALKFVGIGSDLTNINPANISEGSISLTNFNVNTSSGIITASKFVGIGSDLTNINPANISEGTIAAFNFSIHGPAGIITSSKFVGMGSDLTNIDPANISEGSINLTNFNVDTSSGIITASKFVGIGSELLDINPANISEGSINLTNFNVNTSGIITASEFVGIGSELLDINPANISEGTIDATDFSIHGPAGIITSSKFVGDFVGTGSSITNISGSAIVGGDIDPANTININNVGVITATELIGIGSLITQIDPANISNGTYTSNIRTTGSIAIGYTPTTTGATGEISIAAGMLGGITSESTTVSTIVVEQYTLDSSGIGVTTIHSSFIEDETPNNYRSIDYHIVAINGNNNYQASKVMVIHNAFYDTDPSSATVGIETYSNLVIGNEIAKYSFRVSDDSIDEPVTTANELVLEATYEVGITGITTFKVYAERIG